jgi:hypothetical protein
MSATTFMLDEVINFNFGAIAQPALASHFFGISTAVATVAGITGATEPPTANGYSRYTFTNNQTTHWSHSAGSGTHNDETIVFGANTNTDWGTIRSIFIADSGTRDAGNVLWYYNFPVPFVVQIGATITFAIGSVVITMT